jgi:competence protein ComEC
VSPVAVPANVLAVPVVAAATVAGLVAAVTAPWCLPLAHLAAWCALPACWWMVTVAHLGAQVPGASLPWPAGAGGIVLLAFVVALGRGALRRLRPARRRGLRAAARRSGPRAMLPG